MLAGDVARDVVHRPRAVERDQRDDVAEAVGTHALERIAHAGAFELEHAHRVAAAEKGVGCGIVERQRPEVDLDPAAGEKAARPVEHGQRLKAEEVELDQSRFFDVLHRELGHRYL